MNNTFARTIYKYAQRLDQWPGEDYEGTSVLAGCKAAHALGYMGEYRWAFNIDDMLRAISKLGPVVCGTIWYESMFNTQPNGLLEVDPSSGEVGGHSYIIRGLALTDSGKRGWLGKGAKLRKDVPLLRGRNSWGGDWGKGGDFFVWADDYETHLMPDGDQSIMTKPFQQPPIAA
jgi:hypothetical protein